ncbi:MAG: helix-hairpin-helix domain-containing protein [Bryobacteraceae bacterium]|jgi:competence ComEA-like helix-hairpin-helix protein
MRGIYALIAAAFIMTAAALADDVVLPEGSAKKTVENACGDCHGLDKIVDNPESSVKWRATVNRMVRKGAMLSDAEIDAVVDYLATNFPPDKINVNTASADQLLNALDLSAAEADAIVKYRKANGNFKDLAAIEKVPGVDPKKIEAQRELIAF